MLVLTGEEICAKMNLTAVLPYINNCTEISLALACGAHHKSLVQLELFHLNFPAHSGSSG